MTGLTTALLLYGLIAAALAVVLRGNRGLDAICLLTIWVLFKASPATAVYLLASTVAIPLIQGLPWAGRHRLLVALVGSLALLAGLVMTRFVDTLLWLGVSYFTLRHLHVLLDWWLGRIEAPRLTDYWRYQFFLPVILTGPIHRFPAFTREASRRRVTADAVFAGLERALLGLASVVVVANWALRRLADLVATHTVDQPLFIQHWISSGFDWLQIFFGFGGFSAIAIGLAQIAGITLEENFRTPWRATNLVDFWRRWHITLSSWVRDYLYTPIAARFRAPAVGAFAAMVAMGLWHDFTLYYLLWGLWQGLGISLTQYSMSYAYPIPSWAMRLSVPLWLTLTKPTILWLLEGL